MSPWAPKKPCVHGRCPNFALPGYARCQDHQRQHWRADNDTDRVRGHNSAVHQALRRQVLAEEERCANPYCERPYDRPTLDYIVPLSKGGQQVRENGQRMCLHCNSSRHDKPWSEFLAWEAERARLRGGSGGYAR
jgi:HNH endonuclease